MRTRAVRPAERRRPAHASLAAIWMAGGLLLGIEACSPAPSGVAGGSQEPRSAPISAAIAPATAAPAEAVAEAAASEPGEAAPDCCASHAGEGEAGDASAQEGTLTIPDVELVDQRGRSLRFPELVRGRTVALSFAFTRCTTICPPLAANFAALQRRLQARRDLDVALVTVSLDPVYDNPQRLAAWSRRFGAQPGWTLLTGEKHEVDRLLKALGVFTPLKEDHAPVVLLGHEPTGRWRRVDGFAAPERLEEVLEELVEHGDDHAGALPGAPHSYFPDIELVDQHGRKHRLYSDLMRDKVVVLDSFFAECTGVCPILARNMRAIQDDLGERVGKDVHLISLSVDPERDTPERLAAYAEGCEARPGWYFLTGEPEKVEQVLARLGYAVESREQHSNVLIVGNERTGLWKKVLGLAEPEEVVRLVRTVADDDGS